MKKLKILNMAMKMIYKKEQLFMVSTHGDLVKVSGSFIIDESSSVKLPTPLEKLEFMLKNHTTLEIVTYDDGKSSPITYNYPIKDIINILKSISED